MNAEKTIGFYTDILGFSIKERIRIQMPPLREVIYLSLGGTVIEIVDVENPSPRGADSWVSGGRGYAKGSTTPRGKQGVYLQAACGPGRLLAWRIPGPRRPDHRAETVKKIRRIGRRTGI
ncbi:MAG: VOC family protein [Lentisphaerae bacterium]|nr:VOC family protein [Lentisphaerota bacterium]